MKKRFLVACLLASAAFAGSASAATINPVSVTASSTFWTYNVNNLINDSGLSGGLHSGGENYGHAWMTDTTGQPAWLTFDLGSTYALDAARIWQYNVDFGMGYSLTRGAKDIALSRSLDGINFSPVTTGVLAKGTGLPIAGQDFTLDGNARYVRLDLFNNYGDQYNWTGLSEVKFIGSAVPEPESWIMMITGFGAVGYALRRSRRRIASFA